MFKKWGFVGMFAMESHTKAFALLEFLIFILVLGILVSAMLGSLAVIGLENFRIVQDVDIYNVPMCNKIVEHCVFRSSLLDSTLVYEMNATIP